MLRIAANGARLAASLQEMMILAIVVRRMGVLTEASSRYGRPEATGDTHGIRLDPGNG